MSLQLALEARNVEGMVFGYCMEVIFHRDATNSLENTVHLGTTDSDEEGCTGRKLAGVDEVEGNCASVNLVSLEVIVS